MAPGVKSTFAANDDPSSAPPTLTFRSTDTTCPCAAARSGFPSPSRSTISTWITRVPVILMSTLEASDDASKLPGVLVLRNTDTV